MRKIILKMLISLIILVSKSSRVKYIKLYDKDNKTLKVFMKTWK